MLNLIMKDLLIQKKQVLFSLIYVLFIIVTFQHAGSAIFSAGVVAFTYMLSMTSCAYEDQNKSDIMMNSLPVKRSQIVAAKYGSIFVFFGMGTMVYIISSAVIGRLGLPVNVYPITLERFVGGVFAVCLLAGIYFPVFFKFGYIKSKIFNFLLFFGFFFGISFFISSLKQHKYTVWLENAVNMMKAQSQTVITLAVLLCTIMILLISFGLSVYFYNRREF